MPTLHLVAAPEKQWIHPAWCDEARCNVEPLDVNHLSALLFERTLDKYGDFAVDVTRGRDDDINVDGQPYVALRVSGRFFRGPTQLDLKLNDALDLAAAIQDVAHSMGGAR